MNDELYSDINFERLAAQIMKAWPNESQALDHARTLAGNNPQGIRLFKAVQSCFKRVE